MLGEAYKIMEHGMEWWGLPKGKLLIFVSKCFITWLDLIIKLVLDLITFIIGAATLYHTQSRAESVSFSTALNYGSQSIYIKNPANVYNYLAYLEPLTYWSWISILIMLIAFAFIIHTMTKLVKEPIKTSIFESFETVYLALFLMSSPFKPSYFTTRIVLFM